MATSTFNLSQSDFDSIVDTAGYAIGYWASSAVVDDTGSYSVTDSDDRKTYVVTRATVEQAVLDLHSLRKSEPLNSYFQRAIELLVVEGDASDVDADVADVLIQQACFGSVVYG